MLISHPHLLDCWLVILNMIRFKVDIKDGGWSNSLCRRLRRFGEDQNLMVGTQWLWRNKPTCQSSNLGQELWSDGNEKRSQKQNVSEMERNQLPLWCVMRKNKVLGFLPRHGAGEVQQVVTAEGKAAAVWTQSQEKGHPGTLITNQSTSSFSIHLPYHTLQPSLNSTNQHG